MPALVLLLLLPVLVVLALALVPLGVVWRYRAGTARQQARGWLATLNLVMIVLSSLSLLVGAAITNVWVPRAFASAAAGLLAGGLLGGLGLRLSRWEAGARSLHVTPNRWLVLVVTLVVAGRLGYGFWRAWHAWQASAGEASWLVAAGIPGSLAAGALVLGYMGAFWAGVRRRVRRHERGASHPAAGAR